MYYVYMCTLYPPCWLNYCTHFRMVILHYTLQPWVVILLVLNVSFQILVLMWTLRMRWAVVFNDQVIMICMVLNTILYMDGDVKNKTIEQLLLSLHTKTSVSLGISSPSAMFVSYTLERDVVYKRPCWWPCTTSTCVHCTHHVDWMIDLIDLVDLIDLIDLIDLHTHTYVKKSSGMTCTCTYQYIVPTPGW